MVEHIKTWADNVEENNYKDGNIALDHLEVEFLVDHDGTQDIDCAKLRPPSTTIVGIKRIP